jgi:cytochrome c-type biogenesis protein CcmE
MSKKATRAVLSGAVVLAAVTLLLYTTVSEGAQYYAQVDEIMSSPEQWYGKTIQMHGFVVDKSIQQRRGALEYRFQMRTGDHVVDVTYKGIATDGFKDGAELVLTGRLGPNGFQADKMTAKCPSKYEAGAPPPPSVR